ncbi:PKD domain-containing protein [Catalinimonas alkaloidigena]|nr:PKD domain-containing protein [Catalinimonas alkaloidigena]
MTPPTALCSQEPAQFTDASTWKDGTIRRWRWDFGNGQYSEEQHPVVTYADPGTYQVTLLASDSSGCGNPVTKTVVVQPGPDVAFAFSRVCFGDSVAFQDLTSFPNGTAFASRSWNFGDTASGTANYSSLPAPTHYYADTGTYTVTLVVSTANGCENILQKQVRIYALPEADFTYEMPAVALDSNYFTDVTKAIGQKVQTWHWDFGDGGTDTRQHPAHFYNQPGSYTVRLAILTEQGCADTLTKVVQVENRCPEVSFSLSATEVDAGEAITVTPAVSADAVSLEWDFCTGDLALDPLVQIGTLLPAGLAAASVPAVVQQDSVWFAFVASSTGNLYRAPLDSNLAPLRWDYVGNPSGKLSNVKELHLLKEGNTWYGLAINRDNQNLIRITFGSRLDNDDVLPMAEVVRSLGVTPSHLKIVQEKDAIFGFVVSEGSNVVRRLSFGSSVLALPTVEAISSPLLPSGISLRDLALVQDCNEWWGVLVSSATTYYRLEFGRSLANSPIIKNLTNRVRTADGEVMLLDNPVSVSALQEGGAFYALVHNASGVLWRMQFGASMRNDEVAGTRFANLGMANLEGVRYAKRGSTWAGWGVNRSTRQPYRVMFPNACHASVATVQTTSAEPQTLTYAKGGDYQLALRVTNARGDARSVSRSIHVNAKETTPITCEWAGFNAPATVCAFDSVSLQNVSGAQATNFSWDFCVGELLKTPTTRTTVSGLAGNLYLGLEPVWYQGKWYLFSPLFDASAKASLGRYTLSSDMSTVTASTNWGNVGGTLNYPGHLRIVEDHSAWWGLVANRADYTLTRLGFGNALTNDPTAEALPLINRANGDLELVKDPRDGWVALVSSQTDNNLAVLQFGSSLANGPTLSYIVPGTAGIPGTTALEAMGVIRECDHWYVLLNAPTVERFYLLDFGNSLLNTPTLENISFQIPGVTDVNELTLVRDGGNILAFMSLNGGEIVRANFGASIRNTPTLTRFSNLGVERPWGLKFVQNGSTWTTFVAHNATTGAKSIKRLVFPENCGLATAPVRKGAAPGPLVYTEPGLHQLSLTASDANGNTTTFTRSIQVQMPVRPDFETAGGQCVGQPISFLETTTVSAGGIQGVRWDFGDGTSSSEFSPQHSYTATGTYTVRLTVTSTLGCVIPKEHTLRIYPKPHPDFTYEAEPCANDSIVFRDVSQFATDTIRTWSWNFAGLGTSREQNPVFIFPEAGTYPVTLTVRGVSGCDTSVTRNVTLKQGPVVDFAVNGKQAQTLQFCLGEILSFQSAVDLKGTAQQSFAWNFGDGTSSNEPNPVHVFSTPGTYRVALTVANDLGCTTTRSRQVQVRTLPSADFSFTANCVGNTTTFTVTNVSTDSNYDLQWNFGDGTEATGDVVRHTYDSAGTYNVRLTILTQFGCASTTVQQVPVTNAPAAQFAFAQTCGSSQVDFSNQGLTGTGVVYAWSFGDLAAGQANFSAEENPAHAFTAPGRYRVALQVTDLASNCSSVVQQWVDVYEAGNAAFAYEGQCVNQPTQFWNQSTLEGDSVVRYHWDFAGIDSSQLQHPSFTFPDTGRYEVHLAIETARGCFDDTTLWVQVFAFPIADFTYGSTSGPLPLAVNFTNLTQNASSFEWTFGDGATSTDASPVHAFAEEGAFEVVLIARSEGGCADTLRQVVNIEEQVRQDVHLTNLEVMENAGSLTVRAELKNEGNTTITGLTLRAELGNDVILQEQWIGELRPGGTVTHTFASRLLNRAALPYLCVAVDALPAETQVENNRLCNVRTTQLQVFEPYPNPVNHQAELMYVLPTDGRVELQVVDMTGQEALREVNETAAAGVHRHQLLVEALRPGVYHVVVLYAEQRVVRKLVVLH